MRNGGFRMNLIPNRKITDHNGNEIQGKNGDVMYSLPPLVRLHSQCTCLWLIGPGRCIRNSCVWYAAHLVDTAHIILRTQATLVWLLIRFAYTNEHLDWHKRWLWPPLLFPDITTHPNNINEKRCQAVDEQKMQRENGLPSSDFIDSFFRLFLGILCGLPSAVNGENDVSERNSKGSNRRNWPIYFGLPNKRQCFRIWIWQYQRI